MCSPMVSILIPVYNREEFIGECIQSALDQTYSDHEIIVVDNASTDNTWKVCQAYAKKDSRVRIFRNDTNIGPVRNWRRCFEEARGRFGKILFSDDLMHERYLEKTLPLMEEDVAFVFSRVLIGKHPNEGECACRWKRRTGHYSSQRFIESSLFHGGVPVSPGAALFRMEDLRRNLMEEIPSPTMKGFAEHGAGPDLLLYLLAAKDYARVGYVDETLIFYRRHEGSITCQKGKGLRAWYTQAKGWFVLSYLDEVWIKRFLVGEWLKSCRDERRWVPWNDVIIKYPIHKKRIKVGFSCLPWVLFVFFLRLRVKPREIVYTFFE